MSVQKAIVKLQPWIADFSLAAFALSWLLYFVSGRSFQTLVASYIAAVGSFIFAIMILSVRHQKYREFLANNPELENRDKKAKQVRRVGFVLVALAFAWIFIAPHILDIGTTVGGLTELYGGVILLLIGFAFIFYRNVIFWIIFSGIKNRSLTG